MECPEENYKLLLRFMKDEKHRFWKIAEPHMRKRTDTADNSPRLPHDSRKPSNCAPSAAPPSPDKVKHAALNQGLDLRSQDEWLDRHETDSAVPSGRGLRGGRTSVGAPEHVQIDIVDADASETPRADSVPYKSQVCTHLYRNS